jgi:hypothetical protein
MIDDERGVVVGMRIGRETEVLGDTVRLNIMKWYDSVNEMRRG